jgi:uncharacterized protein (TIGR01244 family)
MRGGGKDAGKGAFAMTQSAFRTITSNFSASPQISAEDVATAKVEGFTLIINNRPDGEEDSAPQGADIMGAAADAGLAYICIPITHAGFSGPQVEAMVAALKGLGDGERALAYCRSGTRSTLLWALARAQMGGNPMNIANNAAKAGYDISPVRPMVDALAAAAE